MSTDSFRSLMDVPVVGAPLSGGASTSELAAAVSEAGGFGFLAAGYKTAVEVQREIEHVRTRTQRPFGVNLFFPTKLPVDEIAVTDYIEGLAGEAERYGVPCGEPRCPRDCRLVHGNAPGGGEGRDRGRGRRTRRPGIGSGRASSLVRRHRRGARRPARPSPARSQGDRPAARRRGRNRHRRSSCRRDRRRRGGRADRQRSNADTGGRNQPTAPRSVQHGCTDSADACLHGPSRPRNRQPVHARPRRCSAEGIPAHPLRDRAASRSGARGWRRRGDQPMGRAGLPAGRGRTCCSSRRALGCGSTRGTSRLIRVGHRGSWTSCCPHSGRRLNGGRTNRRT